MTDNVYEKYDTGYTHGHRNGLKEGKQMAIDGIAKALMSGKNPTDTDRWYKTELEKAMKKYE